ncbi:hypothetical protein GJ688_16410 [Heliobacillus mobilis]|uniref:Uncharacterized protein n=2 Tax=Heliobacterium TaxID=2697 RepID=A0A6I3SNP9_HELMO|nr:MULTISPECIES: hypothetical protein [Heliobacterium]MBC9785345.1 hypothetical protein [Heliobacterium chlorum]MTV50529.1 hypothetical protein [Heliobacterium mobile]
MNNEEFQRIVLQELKELKEGQKEIHRRLDRMERSQEDDIVGMLKTISRKIDDLQEDQRSMTAIIGEHEVKIRTLSRRPV